MSTLKHSVSPDIVKQLTTNYEKSKNKILKEEFQAGVTLPTSETFDRAAFDQLLSQKDCVGIRIYYGMDEESNVKLVVVGVNKNEQDLLTLNSYPTIKGEKTTEEPVVAFTSGLRCPPDCPPPPPPPPQEG